MKKIMTIILLFVFDIATTHAQTLGSGLLGEITFSHKKMWGAIEGKERALFSKTLETEMSTAIAIEGGYVLHREKLLYQLGIGTEYHIQEKTFSLLVASNIEKESFATGIKLMLGKEEIGGEWAGTLFMGREKHLGIGLFIEAIPLVHPVYTGGCKISYRFGE